MVNDQNHRHVTVYTNTNVSERINVTFIIPGLDGSVLAAVRLRNQKKTEQHDSLFTPREFYFVKSGGLPVLQSLDLQLEKLPEF